MHNSQIARNGEKHFTALEKNQFTDTTNQRMINSQDKKEKPQMS